MTVEQTTQLIQLVLNSVLMVLACAFVLGGLLLRRSVLENRLQTTSIEYFQILHRVNDLRGESDGHLQSHRFRFLKKRLRHLQQQVKATHVSILGLYYALMLFATSVFSLSMRTIVSAAWLISSAMALFLGGVVILLFSVALVLLELHKSENPVWQEMRETFMLGKTELASLRGQRTTTPRNITPRTTNPSGVTVSSLMSVGRMTRLPQTTPRKPQRRVKVS
jgi:hypothetical protein